MMEGLSPVSRRVVAVALLLLAMISTVNLIALPLIEWTQMALNDLENARLREQRVTAAANSQAPSFGNPIPAELLVIADNQATAFDQVTGVVSAVAAKNEVRVDGISPALTGGGNRVAFDIKGSGSETSLVKMLSELEVGSPTVRCESWTILAPDAPEAPAKFLARGIAVWSPPR